MFLRSSRSSATNPRFGNLGIFSVGVIAFALATLQGCAPMSAMPPHAKEPGVSPLPLGSMRADEPARAESRGVADRSASERASSRPVPARTFRPEYCQRCGAQ